MNPSCALKWERANAVETAGWLGNNLVRTRDHGTLPTRGNHSPRYAAILDVDGAGSL
jgi:hypothetical protein